jgi:RNA polymerase sigma-70 factor (family 1)
MPLEEKEIIERIRLGDKDAFEKLFLLYYSAFCRYAYRFLHDKEESEELVQNFFFNLWEKRNTLVNITSLKAYLFRAIHNSCLNYIKHEKIVENFRDYAVLQSQEQEDYTNEAVNGKELEIIVEKAIQSLPEKVRNVFNLKKQDGLKYQEIAEMLNISVKTVEAYMSTALKILRENLKDYIG